MNVILIFPKVYWKFEKTPYPPLGLGYIAAILQNKEYNVSIIDGQILNPDQYESKLQNVRGDVVGISAALKQMKELERIVRIIKKNNSNIIIIVGGPIATALRYQEIKNIDLIVGGEVEKELFQILDQAKEEKKSDMFYSCKVFTDFEDIPYSARNLFPLEKYLEIWKKNTGMTSTSIISSRGCPYGCIFCDKTVSGKKFRARSANSVVNEMEYLFQRYELDEVFFYDDLFIFDRSRVIAICKEIKSRKLNISWSAQGRVNRIDSEVLQAMKDAGCSDLYFGAESGSDKILKYLKKGFKHKQIVDAFKICHRVGIQPGMYLILGVPGETREDIELTKKLIEECRPFLLNFSYLTPFPGTQLFEDTKQWIKHYDYSKWDEMSNSIYNFPFEINPKIAHDEIYDIFQRLVDKGMQHSSLQFHCDQ